MQTEARTQARFYDMTQQDADAAPNVVSGIISILDHDSENTENVCTRVWRVEERHYGRGTFICICYASR